MVPSWELEGGLSSTLWLPALLSKEAVSGLEAKLCCCPRPALLQPRSPSAPEAASGSGWCWDFPPLLLCWRAVLRDRGAAACLPLHPPSLTCCGCPLGGQQGGMAVGQKVQHGGTLWGVPGGDCGLQLQGLKWVPECWQQPACCVPVSQGCRQGK